MNLDVEKFVTGLHDYFAKEMDPVIKRLVALEARQLVHGEKGDSGLNGKDGAPGLNGKDGAPGINGKDGAVGVPGVNGKDGMPGLNGKDGAVGVPGVNGKDGMPGLNGKDGAVGVPGVNGKDGAPGINGKDGVPGIKGDKGEKGTDGKDGLDGKDGVSVSEEDVEKIVQRQVSVWALDFERRAVETLQRTVDKFPAPKDGVDGKNGADGKDGLGFDDFSAVQLDGKRVKLVFMAGSNRKEFVVKFPFVSDEGVFASGKSYSKGDGVTYGGSFWIAQVDNPNQSPGKGAEWRLAVKRGRDAQEVKP